MNYELSTKRHSLAHIMAQAVKQLYPEVKIATGPDTEDGFYYDFDFWNIDFSDKDLKSIEKVMKKIITQNQDFKRFDVNFDEARKIIDKMWEWFKNEIVTKIENWDFKNKEKLSDKISFYINISKWNVENEDTRSLQDFLKENNFEKFEELDWDQIKNLKFIDMCTGPHVSNTKDLDPNSFKLARVAGAYWLWNSENKQLTRIYAYAFNNKEELDNHLNMMEEAKRRDHRILWEKLKLFTISKLVWSGLPLIQPNGMVIRKEIEDYLWSLHKDKWYDRVWTPHLAKEDLYHTSGHAEKFWDEIFKVKWLDDNFFLKPMNCPHHMQIFSDNQFSYRDMPIRYFEPATVYRDEKTWQLSWLTRVRAITQDDGHLFCRINQIQEEVWTIVSIIKKFYETMWMLEWYWVRLSIRWPEWKYLWWDDVWQKAEWALRDAADKYSLPYKIWVGEAAFYGPKLDFMFKDAIGREWQLATIQCDFNLPERFNLSFTNENNEQERPVVIHRAISWSLERFMWVMIEHFAGIFPLWLAPRQVRIIPVSDKFDDYAKKVEEEFKKINIRVSSDYSSDWLNKKVRNAEKMHINYILVIWEQEEINNTVSVRNYKTKEQTVEGLEEFKLRVIKEIKNRSL